MSSTQCLHTEKNSDYSSFSIVLNTSILIKILLKAENYYFNDICLKTLDFFYLTFLYLNIHANKPLVEAQPIAICDYYYFNFFSIYHLQSTLKKNSSNFFVNNYSLIQENSIIAKSSEDKNQEDLHLKQAWANRSRKFTNNLLLSNTTLVSSLSLYNNFSTISKVSPIYFDTEITQGQLIFKNLGYLRLMQQEYISSIFGEKLILITNNYLSYLPLPFLKEQGLLLVNSFRFLKRTRVGSRLVAIVLSFLRFKDPELIMQAIVDTFEQMHYSKHKLLFRLWRYLITIFPKVYMNFYRVGGLKLEFRGKLAVGGNSKKRAYLFKVGLNSNSSKITKTLLKQGVVRTATGVLSCNLSIYY